MSWWSTRCLHKRCLHQAQDGSFYCAYHDFKFPVRERALGTYLLAFLAVCAAVFMASWTAALLVR